MTKELNAYLKQGYRKRAILAEFAEYRLVAGIPVA